VWKHEKTIPIQKTGEVVSGADGGGAKPLGTCVLAARLAVSRYRGSYNLVSGGRRLESAYETEV